MLKQQGPVTEPKYPNSANVVVGPFSRPAPARPRRELPAQEEALWEAAIQLDLVTVNTAETQIAQGKTVATWLAGQRPGAEGDRKAHPSRRPLDMALLLASVMLSILVLIGSATAIVWAFKSLT